MTHHEKMKRRSLIVRRHAAQQRALFALPPRGELHGAQVDADPDPPMPALAEHEGDVLDHFKL